MALLEVPQIRYVQATIRLDETTATLVDQYAAFLHAPADDVVDKALAYVFAKDREFQEFLQSPEAARFSPSLRVRKPTNNSAEGTVKKPANRGARGRNPAASATGVLA
jgi:hypothetical protein